jgi:hypothetical protein
MTSMVTRKVYLRPIMSPSRPNSTAPKGRTRKPAANASSANRKAEPASSALKNWRAMMAARAP